MEWLWNPLNSFVTCSVSWPYIKFNSIPTILNLLTNRNITLIYSFTICEQKTKECALSGSFQHKLQHRCFQLCWLLWPVSSIMLKTNKDIAEHRDGAVVRVLTPTNEAQVQIPALMPYDNDMWVVFVVGYLPCSERFFSGFSGFPLSSKTNISKFKFEQKSGRRKTTCWMCNLQIIIIIIYLNSSAKLWNFTSTYKIFALFGHIILSYLMIFKALSLVVSMIWYDIHLLLFYQKLKKTWKDL